MGLEKSRIMHLHVAEC